MEGADDSSEVHLWVSRIQVSQDFYCLQQNNTFQIQYKEEYNVGPTLGLCLGWYGLTGTVFTAGEVAFTGFALITGALERSTNILLLFIEQWRHLADSNEPTFIKKKVFLNLLVLQTSYCREGPFLSRCVF